MHNKANNSNNNYARRNYSSFWAFMFSLIPGAGHMYLGLMNRGVQLMITFFALLAIPNILYFTDFIGLFSIIIWFYSVFDSYHIRKRINMGELVEDKTSFNIDLRNINYNHLGIGLTIFGSIVLLDNVILRMPFIDNHSHSLYVMMNYIRKSIFPVLLIVIGVILLRKSKRMK